MNGFNSEKYLRNAIDSVYAQTFEDWIIVFIDNCSTDDTENIVRSYDKKIKYYKTKTKLNLGSARNYGLKFCKSNFLAFLDTDDIWDNKKLEKQINAIDKNTALVYSSVITIDSKGKKLWKTRVSKHPCFTSLLKRYDINMQSVLLNTEMIKSKLMFNEKLSYCPDYDLFMNLAAKKLEFKSINDPLVSYRLHIDSLSSKTRSIQVKEIYTVIKSLKKKYPSLYKHHKALIKKTLFKTKILFQAKYLLKDENFFAASKSYFKLSNFHLKYLLISIILFFPLLNRVMYNLILKKIL